MLGWKLSHIDLTVVVEVVALAMKLQLQWNNPERRKRIYTMGLLPDTQNYGVRIRRECRERLRVNDPDARAVMHAGVAN